MAKRYVSNDTAGIIFVGGLLLQPGEGREVDEIFLPPEAKPDLEVGAASTGGDGGGDPDAEKLDENLREVLKGSIGDIKPQLPAFSPATLARLLELEQADGSPRKGLVQVITELQLERAQAATGGAPT